MNQTPSHKTLGGSDQSKSQPVDVGEDLALKPVGKEVSSRFGGLSSKLLLLTIGFVMLSEVFVFVPSVAKFRNDWLTDRLTRARTVILLTDPQAIGPSLPGASEEAADTSKLKRALMNIDIVTLAYRSGGRKELVAMIDDAAQVAATFDVNETGPIKSIRDAFGTLLATEPRTILVTGAPPGNDELIELVAREEPLRQAMLIYTRNVMILSLIISGLTATMVYIALTTLFVRPIKNMAENMVSFSKNPEKPSNVIEPSGRGDELGIAEERLAAMQTDLQGTLSNQKRLANLGLAVSKVNHDLRNILASVQLFSDRLATVSDPSVQKFAPKLINGIDRAINYCQATLVYGSATEEPPKRRVVRLHDTVDEMASLLNLEDHELIEWQNLVPEALEINADPEQIFRVVMNLSRNAIKALESMEGDTIVRRLEISAHKESNAIRVVVRDTGPGVPERAKQHLFEAFRGSVSKGGIGLGLAIANEIIRAHGGTLRLLEDDMPGAAFEIELPDQVGKVS